MNHAITIDGIGKRYRLGVTHASSLRDLANGAFGRLTGRRSTPGVGEDDKSSSSPPAKEFWALKDVTFNVNEGDTLGIIGRNGAGKSTLLKVLSRITSPTEGKIEIFGRVASLLEVGTGFHPELTGRENVFLNGTILGMTRAEVTRQFDAIVDFAGVAKFVDTPVKRYSSGMKVRLGFAVAAHLDPEILIVDEVLAVGDLEFQRKCLGKMGQVAKSGRTILFVSHNMSAVAQLCNKGVVLHQGQTSGIQAIADAIDLYVQQTPTGDREGIFLSEVTSDHDRITEIRVQQDGNDSATVKHDQEIDILFRMQSPHRTFPLLLSVAICDRFQRFVFTAATRIDSIDHWGRNGELIRRLRIRKRFLMPGRYSVVAGILDSRKKIVDEHHFVCSFGIENAGDSELVSSDCDQGIVFGEFEWLEEQGIHQAGDSYIRKDAES